LPFCYHNKKYNDPMNTCFARELSPTKRLAFAGRDWTEMAGWMAQLFNRTQLRTV
jgi:hypothetical protein